MRWPLQPLQPFQQTQLQPPFGQSVDSLCHPWFTTINLSYRFPIFETSATALCGTTGRSHTRFQRFLQRCSKGKELPIMKPWQKHRQSEGFVGDIHQKKNVLEGYTTLWWKTALTDGCKRSLMHLSLWILLIMAKIEIFHRKRPPWPSLYLSTGLEDRRSHWHVLMHSFSCQDAQNIWDDKMWCWM